MVDSRFEQSCAATSVQGVVDKILEVLCYDNYDRLSSTFDSKRHHGSWATRYNPQADSLTVPRALFEL